MKSFYPEEIIEEVRTSNDIVDVVSEYVQLKKKGKNYFGICPFHNEKTPSFSVSPEKQIFYCFGCNEGGNVIGFIMKIENLSFIEAIQLLAKRSGITLPETEVSSELKKKKSEIQQLYSVNKEAAKFFYRNLYSKEGAPARAYLKKRGIDEKTIKKFGLGYSLDEWEALNDYLVNKGFSQEIICKAGLARKSKKSNYIDTFRNRIIFPIFDVSSNIIGFGGRALGDDLPKYLNTPETLIFNKGKNLYALNFVKKSDSRRIVIVEGYMDVITLHQNGLDYAVASLGTALTEEQAKLLRRYCNEVIVAYDSDAAGQAATLRSIEMLNDMKCNVKVMQLPEGKDPDEFVKKNGIGEFLRLIDISKNYVEFKIDFLKQQYNIKNIEGKIKFLNEMSTVLSKIDNNIERDAYIKILSDQTGISTESIIAQVNKKQFGNDEARKKIKNIKQDKKVNIQNNDKLDYAEKLLIYLICQNDVYKKFADVLNIDLFTYEVNRKIASVIFDRLNLGQDIEPGQLMLTLTNEDEINAISKIFGLNENIEDIDKAVTECLNYINKVKKDLKRSEILKMSDSKILDDISKIKELDELIRSKYK